MRKIIFHIIFILLVLGMPKMNFAQQSNIGQNNLNMLEVIMEDIFSPPVASRIHAYSNIAAYEVIALKSSSISSLAGKIKHLKPLPSLPRELEIDYPFTASLAFYFTLKKFIYSEYIVDSFIDQEKKIFKTKLSNSKFENSIQYAERVAAHIINWAKEDNYIYTRTLQRYVLNDSLGAWKPTPPEYANGLEPNWGLMRSFVADSGKFLKAIPNIAYSEKVKSLYYQNAKQVYTNSKVQDSSKINIALYWDDNPNTAVSTGHLTYFTHKVTPGGHWLKIANQAINAKKLNEEDAVKIFTLASIAEYEAFINCWQEKYISNAVRPETYIAKLMDPNWKPLIETPPFPEYTSGHSVVSAAMSGILTKLIKQPYSFYDSSQTYLNLQPRFFKSFKAAANEASISRFYGGIHYMPSLTNGAKQGDIVAKKVLETLYMPVQSKK